MKISDAINRVDLLHPNSYSPNQKVEYLSKLDKLIKQNIIDKHKDGENIVFDGYDMNTPFDTELLVPSPYDDIYVFWLQAWINFWNEEYDRYNSSISMYQSMYDAFYNDYHSKHMPKSATKMRYW